MGTRDSKTWGPDPSDLLARKWSLRVKTPRDNAAVREALNAISGGVCSFGAASGGDLGSALEYSYLYETEEAARAKIAPFKANKNVDRIVLTDARQLPIKEEVVYERQPRK
jgi:hypothetical protein